MFNHQPSGRSSCRASMDPGRAAALAAAGIACVKKRVGPIGSSSSLLSMVFLFEVGNLKSAIIVHRNYYGSISSMLPDPLHLPSGSVIIP